ncbi:MAG: leucyl aminopeptidase family protein [Alphaproteobacteria bacterium]
MAKERWRHWVSRQPLALRRWAESAGFAAEPGKVLLVPGAEGRIGRVVVGIDPDDRLWQFAGLPALLPKGSYRIDVSLDRRAANQASLGWALGAYAFDRYKKRTRTGIRLVWPDRADRAHVTRQAEATFLVRDLVNTPANDLGPVELAAAARALARRHGARFEQCVGQRLVDRGYPLIHAVGRASARAPRLIDLRWGRQSAPRVTLVGKGVCFDSGGLDLKSSAFMLLQKKDMGGAAQILGLADLIMGAKLPVRLRVLVPAVENSVAGDAMRPLDVVKSRKGLTVEIGNTDAEGRLILADALAEADRESPELIIDCATLTGAARVALGPDVPAVYTNDDKIADELLRAGIEESDPLWRLPLWAGYRKTLDSKVADIHSVSEGSFAGSITAALFLKEFVATDRRWIHLDMMAWNPSARPGRPVGGEAQGMRALFRFLEGRYGRR